MITFLSVFIRNLWRNFRTIGSACHFDFFRQFIDGLTKGTGQVSPRSELNSWNNVRSGCLKVGMAIALLIKTPSLFLCTLTTAPH